MSNRFTSRLSDNDDYKRDELIRKIEHAVEHIYPTRPGLRAFGPSART